MNNAKNIIAFMGVAGANADLACRQFYPYMETLPKASFDDVFEAVENEEAALGLIPIENSHVGRVAEIHTILPKSDISIVSEHFQGIQHNIYGANNAKLSDVKDIYSHPQALMQCHENLKKLKIKPNHASNTAIAAQQISDWNDKTKAALCSELAGELYKLTCLRKNLQDSDDNVTVFVAISKHPPEKMPNSDMVLTSLIFTIRNISAALYKALAGFATNNINMIKLESYINATNSSEAQFFMTFEGRPEDKGINNALEELGFFCKKVKIVGVYNADKSRKRS